MKLILPYLLFLAGLPAFAQKKTKLKLNITTDFSRREHISSLIPDTIRIFRLPGNILAFTIPSSKIDHASIELRKVPVGTYHILTGLMPPVDRLLFASNSELTARLKRNASLLKIFPNLGAYASFIAMISFPQKNYIVTICILVISVSLMLVVPIVLFVNGGRKALSLKLTMPPANVPRQSLEKPINKPVAIQRSYIQRTPPTSSTSTTKGSPKPHIKRKYYSANAWRWNWPIPKELQSYPLKEEGFNQLIRGF